MPDVSLVVPVFDEEENLRPLHAAITDAMGDRAYEVLYVNDGLTISARFCELLGGRLEIESEIGFGSVFSVFIPRRLHPTIAPPESE